MQSCIKNKLLAVDEAEIAKLVSDGGLKPETLARRKRVRAAESAEQVKDVGVGILLSC